MIFVITICVLFSGCKEYGEKRIVNFIVADDKKIAVYYYDFSSEEETSIKEEYLNMGIENTLVDMLSDHEYNLKLCRYIVVDEEYLQNNIREIYFALTDCRFAPDIVILAGDTNLEFAEYLNTDKRYYPIYNYKFYNDDICGVVERLNGNGKILIYNDRVIQKIDDKTSLIFDILNNIAKTVVYTFEYQDSLISAKLDNIKTFQYTDRDTLNISVTAIMKNYKGMAADIERREYLKQLLEEDIHKQAQTLLQDTFLAEKFGLVWCGKTSDYKNVNINVNII